MRWGLAAKSRRRAPAGTTAIEEVWSSWLTRHRDRHDAGLLFEQKARFVLAQHPESINSKRGAERKIQQIQSGDDHPQNACPLTKLQQADTGNYRRHGEDRDRNGGESSDHP